MNYELAKKLKEKGFPKKDFYVHTADHPAVKKGSLLEGQGNSPTLEELIGACGDKVSLWQHEKGWSAAKGDTWNGLEEDYCDNDYSLHANGPTPLEAVANLWIALQDSNK